MAMKAVKTILSGGAALVALAVAAPASAQFFPGYGYGSGDILGTVIGSVITGGYGSPYGYGDYGSTYGYGGGRATAGNSQYAVGQCMGAVQQRLNSTYSAGQGAARVLGVSDVQQRNQGGMIVSGVANSGRTGTYGYNNSQPPVDLTFTCKTDASGMVSSIEVGQAAQVGTMNYGAVQPSPYANDYSQYGYRRY
jgi:hypothetical protein